MIFIWRTLSGVFFIMVFIPCIFVLALIQGVLVEFTRFTYHYFYEEKSQKKQMYDQTYNELVLRYPIALRISKETWLMWFDFWDVVGRPFNPFIYSFKTTILAIKSIEL